MMLLRYDLAGISTIIHSVIGGIQLGHDGLYCECPGFEQGSFAVMYRAGDEEGIAVDRSHWGL